MEQKQDLSIIEPHDKSLAITAEMKDVIRSVIFPDSTDAELEFFIYYCQTRGVHPISKLIHPVKRQGKLSLQSSIDYLRSESEDAGDYLGMKQPVFEYNVDGTLDSATVTVLRQINGQPVEFTATAYFEEYKPAPPNDFMWKKMPKHMIAKCAEALARRQAWPKKLGQLYVPEEMQQADVDSKQQRKDRTASVKPAASAAHHETVIDAETTTVNPLDDEIMQILGYLYKGDYQSMNAGMIKASEFPKTKGSKDMLSFGLDRLESSSASWKQKALVKLRAWKAEAEALEAEIKGDGQPEVGEGEQPYQGDEEQGPGE